MRTLFTLLILLLATNIFAQPVNDVCSDATTLQLGGPEICIPFTGTNVDATGSAITPGCASYQGGELWFTVTVPPSGVVIAETSGVDGGIGDSGMAAYSGDCDNLELIECNDDGGVGLFSMLELTDLTPGSQLYLVVWEYGNNAFGEFNICAYQPPTCPDVESMFVDSSSTDFLSIGWPVLSPGATYHLEYGDAGFTQGTGVMLTGINGTDGPPVAIPNLQELTSYDFYLYIECEGPEYTDTISASFVTNAQPVTNDECGSAIFLPVGGPEICIPTTGSNQGASDSGVPHSCANYQGGDVWFTFVAPPGGEVIIETMANNGFADGGLALYGGPCDDLVAIDCNDDGGEGLFSLITASDLTPDEVYYIAVWEYGNDLVGPFDICVYHPPTCPPIGQFSITADSLAFDAAAITWTVENDGAEFVVEFGPTGFPQGSGNTITGVTGVDGPPVLITDLSPETTYQVYVQDICGPGDSSQVVGPYTFTTLETCESINQFQVDINSTMDSVVFDWPGSNVGGTFFFEYGAPGFAQGTGTMITGTVGTDGPPIVANGLPMDTDFEFYLYEICSNEDTTDLLGPVPFATLPPPPANDECETAQVLAVGGPLICIPTTGTNEGATDSGVPHGCASYQGGDVWYSFVAPASGDAIIETMGNGGIADGGLALYSGSCDSLTLIECNDDGGDGLFSLITATDLTPGEVYYAAVWEYGNNAFGEFDICVYSPELCPSPTDLGVDSVTMNSVQVTWTVVTPGNIYTVEYGPTGFTPGTGTVLTGTEGTDAPPLLITDLDQDTGYEYYYQSECENGELSGFIGPVTFATLPPPPANDECVGALELTVGGASTCTPISASNAGATGSGLQPGCANYQGGDVWFSFTAPESGEATVETAGNGGIGDSGMALYSGNCDSPELLVCNDDGGVGLYSLINSTDLTPGETYYVAVWEYGGDVVGTFDICVYTSDTLVDGLEEMAIGDFDLYPNPAKDLLTIRSVDISGNVQLEILDLQGKVAQAERRTLLPGQAETLDVSHLESGVYFVRMTSERGYGVRRIVIE